jgi:hypothetical protein
METQSNRFIYIYHISSHRVPCDASFYGPSSRSEKTNSHTVAASAAEPMFKSGVLEKSGQNKLFSVKILRECQAELVVVVS